MKAKVGDIVQYVLPTGYNAGQERPAIIVRMWGEPTEDFTPACQLQVFTDGSNDFAGGQSGYNGMLWATSVAYSEEPKPGTWHLAATA